MRTVGEKHIGREGLEQLVQEEQKLFGLEAIGRLRLIVASQQHPHRHAVQREVNGRAPDDVGWLSNRTNERSRWFLSTQRNPELCEMRVDIVGRLGIEAGRRENLARMTRLAQPFIMMRMLCAAPLVESVYALWMASRIRTTVAYAAFTLT